MRLCLYHRSDLDGKMSAAIVKKYTPGIELYGIEYGDEIPWDKITNAIVYLVDFSLQPWELMERLQREASSVIWIDHHKSAIEECNKYKSIFNGVRDSTKAACELCWDYFFINQPMPHAVWLLGRYDVWDLKAHEDVLPFQMGMRLNDSQDTLTELLLNFTDAIERIVRNGKIVLKYQEQMNINLMRNSFVINWKDLKFLTVNTFGVNSTAFESKFDPKLHDAVMCFYFNNTQWTVTMYSPNQSIDLSGIAKEMGGGGHASACGFQIADISGLLNE